MAEWLVIARSQWQFYRRYPLLSGVFVVGLCLGTALISAIAHLNTEASQRYQTASDRTASPVHYLLQPKLGERYLPAQLWFQLRRAGIRQSQPVLNGRVQLQDGRSLLIRGVNTLALLEHNGRTPADWQTRQFSANSQLLIDTELAARLELDSELGIAFENSSLQYGFDTADNIGPWLLTDISVAHRLLQQQGWLTDQQPQISQIELGALTAQQLEQVRLLIAQQADLSSVEQQGFDLLAESFFFNLTALALLGYGVGLFLSLNALSLMLSARQRMHTQMLTLGCLRQRLRQALLVEMLLLSVLCAGVGNALGLWIAQGLLFDVSRTLVTLYDLDRALAVAWQWRSFGVGLAMNGLALTAVLWRLRTSSDTANDPGERPDQRGVRRIVGKGSSALVGLLWGAVGAGIYQYANNKYAALLLGVWLIVGFALLVLPFLKLVLGMGLPRFGKSAARAASPAAHSQGWTLLHWLRANTAIHLSDIKLAVLAFLIALGAAIGTQVMVRSFALTLDSFLQQRLHADLYLAPQYPMQPLATEHMQALTALPEVAMVSALEMAAATTAPPRWVQGAQGASASEPALPLQVLSYGNHVRHLQHLERTDGKAISEGDIRAGHCLANEPAALRYGWQLGDSVPIKQGQRQLSCRISGFFYDYGTQGMQLVLTRAAISAAGLRSDFKGFALHLATAATVEQLLPRLTVEFDYQDDKIVHNAAFRRMAKSLFSSTFAVTDLLNTLIVAIALTAVWVSFTSMEQQQKNQFGIVQALGITPAQLFVGQLLGNLSLLLLTLLLAIPLGIGLGYVLVKFVIPISFGWSMPMFVDWTNIAQLGAMVTGVAVVVVAGSIWRLHKQAIADLLRDVL